MNKVEIGKICIYTYIHAHTYTHIMYYIHVHAYICTQYYIYIYNIYIYTKRVRECVYVCVYYILKLKSSPEAREVRSCEMILLDSNLGSLTSLEAFMWKYV